MNTAAAAIQANVTAATIRTWCRHGAVAAIKQAGRWVIDAASLAARIAIGAMKRPTCKETRPMIDLTATYTHTFLTPDPDTKTITPKVKERTTRDGERIITVSDLIPLFADRFDAITDDGDRGHALTVFQSARIVITDRYDADWEDDPQAREGGKLRTTYQGGVTRITIADVLDLAEQLRAQLA